MGIYDKDNISKAIRNSKEGGGGAGIPVGRHQVRISKASIRESQAKNEGFSFQLVVRNDEDDDLDGREGRLEFWHHVGFNIENFLAFMEALGFDFDSIEAWSEKTGKEWKHKNFVTEKIFREIEESNVKFYVNVEPQKNDPKRVDIRPELDTLPKLWDGTPISTEADDDTPVKRAKKSKKDDDGDDDERDV